MSCLRPTNLYPPASPAPIPSAFDPHAVERAWPLVSRWRARHSTLLLANWEGETTAVADRRLDEVGKRLRGPVDALPTGTPEHAAALAEYRDALTGLRNRPGGFWIAGPDPLAAEHALAGTVPLESLASVTLLSDGATRLVDKFALADWREVLAVLDSTGPDGLIRRVREVEGGDPDGRRWPRGKTHDDATVVHWPLS
ncbi:hypothetical protein BG846_00422 [Streptomyces fradiae ATCC 10745 = DSM 40063]|uniref:Uncharacterized protein n=1 Tax=Streptomyces fradiae ATCC 10745 = DSM 40063 TaxID=1319510 RepID=A0A1Y2P274_STRFR|nr:hypothetical protein BG846_00422 [Streptomyces fradiae ATCC 10745 = DSM 40063]